MPYAIAHVMYGVLIQIEDEPHADFPLLATTAPFKDFAKEITAIAEGDDVFEDYELFQQFYQGDENSYVFGLYSMEFDETNYVLCKDIPKAPTAKEIVRYRKLLEALEKVATPELYAKVVAMTPTLFIAWGTS